MLGVSPPPRPRYWGAPHVYACKEPGVLPALLPRPGVLCLLQRVGFIQETQADLRVSCGACYGLFVFPQIRMLKPQSQCSSFGGGARHMGLVPLSKTAESWLSHSALPGEASAGRRGLLSGPELAGTLTSHMRVSRAMRETHCSVALVVAAQADQDEGWGLSSKGSVLQP